MSNIMTKKGQTIMSDFSISLAIFLVVVFMGLNIYNDIKENHALSSKISDINDKLEGVSNKLLRSPGVPENWDNNNVVDIGWSEDYPLLNKTKLNYTYYMEYSILKGLLRTDYDFQINISYKNGSIVKLYGNELSYGMSIEESSSVVGHIKRIAYILTDNKRVPVTVDIYMWANKVL